MAKYGPAIKPLILLALPTADGFRNADKSEGSRITCSLGDTTRVYHRQSFTRPAPN